MISIFIKLKKRQHWRKKKRVQGQYVGTDILCGKKK